MAGVTEPPPYSFPRITRSSTYTFPDPSDSTTVSDTLTTTSTTSVDSTPATPPTVSPSPSIPNTDSQTDSTTPSPDTASTPMMSMTTSAGSNGTALPANQASAPISVGSLSANKGISGGAIAGAVIGVLILLGLLGGLFFWYRRRQQQARRRPGATSLNEGNYTEPKPRSRPASRYAPSGVPAVNYSNTHVGRSNSVGTTNTELGAQTYESQGTLANVDDNDDYLEKLDPADIPIGSMTSGTTLAHAEPFNPAKISPPSPTSARQTSNRRGTGGEAVVGIDRSYRRSHQSPPPPPVESRTRTRSQDAPRDASSPIYPPTPASPPLSSSASSQDAMAAKRSSSQRKTPRKKPVPRYSVEGTASPTPDSTPPEIPSPPIFGQSGQPVHYLIPDMPPSQAR